MVGQVAESKVVPVLIVLLGLECKESVVDITRAAKQAVDCLHLPTVRVYSYLNCSQHALAVLL